MSKQVMTLFFIVFLYLVGFGLVIPLIPTWGRDLGGSNFQIGVLMSAYSFMQFIAAPFWGSLSDRFGRRPILLLCLGAEIFLYILFAQVKSFEFLLIVRGLCGLFGGSISTASAYLSDITPPEKRSQSMGLIGAGFGLGMIVGPALGGLLSLMGGASLIGYVVSALYFFTTIAAYFLLPESRSATAMVAMSPAAESSPTVESPNFPSRNGSGKASRLQKMKLFFQRPTLGAVYSMYFLQTMAMASMEANLVLWVKDMWSWNLRQVSFGFVVIGLLSAFVQGYLVRQLLPILGERKLLVIGFSLMALGLALIPLAPSPIYLGLVLTVFILGYGSSQPSILGCVSLLSPASEQGASLGVAQSFSSLARILGPLIGGLLYTLLPWATFVGAASFAFLGLILVGMSYKTLPFQSQSKTN